MPAALSVGRVFHVVPAFAGGEGGRLGILEAAADRSILREDPGGPMLPPAGASRAEMVFMTVGIALMVILAAAFLWTLLRHYRR